jgi:hypothetical protein
VDFFFGGRWFDPEVGRERRIYAFLMTLSHGRHQFLCPVLGEDGVAWLDGHVAAFAFSGGVPKRIVPDNLSAGVLRADRYDPRVNRAYGELARHYGCVIDPSRVTTPTHKPRVERKSRYARDSFFADRSFPSLTAMRTAAATWAREIAGQRVHGTTGEQTLVAFATREQPRLLPLLPASWEPTTWTTAKIQPDCHLTVGGGRYSVPHRYVGRRLEVRLGRGTVQIYDGPELVTAHARRTRGRATRLEHFPDAGQAFLRATPRACAEQAQAIGPATTTLVRGLLITETLHHLLSVPCGHTARWADPTLAWPRAPVPTCRPLAGLRDLT